MKPIRIEFCNKISEMPYYYGDIEDRLSWGAQISSMYSKINLHVLDIHSRYAIYWNLYRGVDRGLDPICLTRIIHDTVTT